MTAIDVTIKVLSPIHLGFGQGDVNLDAEVVHDTCGLPYFPAKRFKGLLYESALEVAEMSALSGSAWLSPEILEEIFHHSSESSVQLIVSDFHLWPTAEYEKLQSEWQSLMGRYPALLRPADVLAEYTSIRYQTRLEKGTAKRGSLHNMRVVNAGISFFGTLHLMGGTEAHLQALALALRNLSAAGMKRNRGFGRIACAMRLEDGRTEQALIEAALKEEVV